MQTMPPSPVRPAAPPSGAAHDLPRMHSSDLFRQGNLVLIEHGGDRYYLRMTRNNKLILTK